MVVTPIIVLVTEAVAAVVIAFLPSPYSSFAATAASRSKTAAITITYTFNSTATEQTGAAWC